MKRDIHRDSVLNHYCQVTSAVILNHGHAHFDLGHSHLTLVSIQVALGEKWDGLLGIFRIRWACPRMT